MTTPTATAASSGALTVIAVLLGAAIASGATIEYLYLGWAWAALLWSVSLVVLARLLRAATATSILLVNFAAVMLAAGLAELWFAPAWTAPEDKYTGDYTADYFVDDELLGYGPRPGSVAASTRVIDGEQIYSTVYTIDAHGLRIMPVSAAKQSILVFGGSFTFGEGVHDAETMPYRLALRELERFAVYNFGFHGYGAHQMLAALEQGRVAAVVSQPVRYVIYQAIPDHILRSAGRAFWDRAGPRYALQSDGTVRFAGHFDDGKSAARMVLEKRLLKSQLYQRLLGVQKPSSEADIAQYVAIVARARDTVAQQFPGAEFHVILWGEPQTDIVAAITAGLEARGVAVTYVANILPDYTEQPQRYQLHPRDTHPNALAHELLAAYLAETVVR